MVMQWDVSMLFKKAKNEIVGNSVPFYLFENLESSSSLSHYIHILSIILPISRSRRTIIVGQSVGRHSWVVTTLDAVGNHL